MGGKDSFLNLILVTCSFVPLRFQECVSLNLPNIYVNSKKSVLWFCSTGFLLLMRVIAVTFCVTLAASMAAHQGPVPMAAFQVCLQVWLATSLLADGLAVAGQVRNLELFRF